MIGTLFIGTVAEANTGPGPSSRNSTVRSEVEHCTPSTQYAPELLTRADTAVSTPDRVAVNACANADVQAMVRKELGGGFGPLMVSATV